MTGLLCVRIGKLRISLWTFIFIGAVLYSDFSIFTLEVLIAATLHECGHLLTMKLFGVKIYSITVLPYGAVIDSDVSLLPYKKEAITSLSGILFNLWAVIASLIIHCYAKDIYTLFFCVCNAFLATVNLIPVPSFDGSRVIEAVLFELCSEENANRYMDNIHYFSFLALVLLSLYVLNITGGNFSLVILLVYMFICVYANKHSEI